MTVVRLSASQPPLDGLMGAGVTVAVIDSGINSGHPHVGRITRGIDLTDSETEGSDGSVDRLGHGTAVAAAIREKAPGAALMPIRVFDHSLATSAAVLAQAIALAADAGCRLINVSLGTPRSDRRPILAPAIEHATALGSIVVSALELDGAPWLPGSLPGVAGVLLDPDCPRDEIRLIRRDDGTLVFAASGLPRPIPDVPVERNLSGISFAVANVTGFLARLAGAHPGARTLTDLF